MALAQTLYEKGYITYMRTDSVALSKDAQAALLAHVAAAYGPAYVHARAFKTRAANAQEAHEAIRPTRPDVDAAALDFGKEPPSDAHRRLYDLIRRRAIASQMTPAEYVEEAIAITPASAMDMSIDAFIAKHSTLIEPGYLLCYSPDQHASSPPTSSPTRALCALRFRAEGNATQPATPFNEPGLVKVLETHGIGRPSTYAAIIDKLFKKGYVTKGAAPTTSLEVASWDAMEGGVVETRATLVLGNKEVDRMLPTPLGQRIIDYLREVAPLIVDAAFTSQMEGDLDAIARGQKRKEDVLNAFYGPFHAAVESAQGARRAAGPKATKAVKAPKPLRSFPAHAVDVVQTRYGPALFKSADKTFTSLSAFLTWQKKPAADLTERDVAFIMSLPIRQEDGSEVALGRYGLYVKRDGKNERLAKEAWDGVFSAHN